MVTVGRGVLAGHASTFGRYMAAPMRRITQNDQRHTPMTDRGSKRKISLMILRSGINLFQIVDSYSLVLAEQLLVS